MTKERFLLSIIVTFNNLLTSRTYSLISTPAFLAATSAPNEFFGVFL